MTDRIGMTEARQEGFYWVVLGQNPPEITYWERSEWWLAGDPKPWHSEAMRAVSERLVFKPRLAPGGVRLDHVLTTPELRRSKLSRADFPALARNPITVVLDDVRGSHNLALRFNDRRTERAQ